MRTIHEEKWAKDIKRQFKKKINYKWLKMLTDAQFQSFFLKKIKNKIPFFTQQNNKQEKKIGNSVLPRM